MGLRKPAFHPEMVFEEHGVAGLVFKYPFCYTSAVWFKVWRNGINISQWSPVCSQLVPLSPTQGPWSRALTGTSQWPQMTQSLVQLPGLDRQLSRKYHTTNKLSTTKDSPQPAEEKVGAFTKIIEAMGFTGPLKYSKWKIKIAALRMYTSCVEKTDFEEFFLTLSRPPEGKIVTRVQLLACLSMLSSPRIDSLSEKLERLLEAAEQL
ncbi:Ubiquinol-cytochrome-c reductase complex assembly factor 1 [Galemys pyrenaicus]|uniref:Ubiquinol-cytochrome-c reductase complex assembly factor 1 n=1 Tax=Galemys pyrenaicus TaxID=202257 RepID=A0A8J6AA08_GALPY|nr:Ubiquinol-cytochrome-c reductase complex assembly factor 1 [Galemys pyrenaicus]